MCVLKIRASKVKVMVKIRVGVRHLHVMVKFKVSGSTKHLVLINIAI